MTDGDEGRNPRPGSLLGVLFALMAAMLFANLFFGDDRPEARDVSYSEFLRNLDSGAFETVILDEAELRGRLSVPADDGIATLRTYSPSVGDPDLAARIEASGAEMETRPPSTGDRWLAWLPLLLFAAIWFWILRRSGGIGGRMPGGADDFLGGIYRKKGGERPKITFADVAGQEQAKREVSELVEFLREPDRFDRVGATVPRGVLLMGPPGTGKTLMARALAGEAGVRFYSTSASEFIEMFVGVGAARVRRMFEEARKNAPAVVFIDELDSVGRARGAGLGGGNDEREQTLNQILAELDGFTGREGVVVLAATNRPDVLDSALLRPGRFDRHVELTLPDKAGRRAILDVHVRKTPLASDVDLDGIAAGCPGFSGADLRNLVNEAAIFAARDAASAVAMTHFEAARDRIMLGPVRTLAIQPDERRRLAVHEAGHAVVAWRTPEADPLYKVTIIPRGRSLGGTHMLPTAERHTMPQGYLRAQLAVLLAGRAAERALLGSVSSGADDDIRRATAIARSMVARWGMSDEIGPMDLRESDDHPFLGREMATPRRFADATAAEVDGAVRALLLEADRAAAAAISADEPAMRRLVDRLEAEETLDAAAVAECLGRQTRRLAGSG